MTEPDSRPVMEHTTARPLTNAEVNAFLARPLIARLATVGENRPQVTPVWFDWDGECLWFAVGNRSRKYRNLADSPHCAVTIDETLGGLRFRAVIMEGTVELIQEPQDWAREVATRIYTKYLGPEVVGLPTPQSMLSHDEHVIIKLKPERIVTWDDTHIDLPVE